MTGPDRRSVGDLLLECDRASRQMLEDPRTLDAEAMLRTWPELVQAATELVDELPTSPRGWGSGPGVVRGGDVVGERLLVLSASTHRQLQARPWPGDGPGDERLLQVTGHLVRVHDLLTRHHRSAADAHPMVRADAAAARTRTLHALYVSTHAVLVAIRHTAPAGHPRGRVRAHQQGSLRLAQRRLEAFEKVVSAEVYRDFPGALRGQWREAPEPDRIGSALARWDVEAHRAVASEPSLGVLLEVTRVQAATAAMARSVLEVAADRRRMDPDMFTRQMGPQLVASEAAWSALHHELNTLRGATQRPLPTDLRNAGSEVVLALADIVLDGAVNASPPTVALRTTEGGLRAICESIGTAGELAAVVKDALDAPDLTTTARAAQARLAARSGGPWQESPDHAWVDPRDLQADRSVPIPAPLAAQLRRQGHHLACVTATLASVPVAGAAPVQPPKAREQMTTAASRTKEAMPR